MILISKPVALEIPVRYIECDPMGIVHHCTYLVWFEMGRVEASRVVGGYAFFKSRKFVYPVIDIQCKYYAPARFGHTVVVETMLHIPTKSMLEFTYQIYSKHGRQLLAEGRSTHTLMTPDGQTVFKLPEPFRERITKYWEANA
ncbi:acyl-CoA thioesterase [Paenibacillus sp. 481]|uniref:acyl-CoA thioesterase n=1 Tax=Paenibacillus sp. 481 TaxID=2835869 RepID=UPI001E3FFE4C|nr:thioesterase family protein [Paenibacillus sp. 481]UHA75637.1 acyl-CoA thioesterase [Paenibacillus sp. 481]